MDNHEINELNNIFQKANPVLQNTLMSPVPGNVAPPMPNLTAMPPIPPTSTAFNPNSTPVNMLPRNYRRVPIQYVQPSTNPAYNGTFGNYPYNRPYMNFNGGYNPYNSYGQPMTNQFLNPVVIAADANSRPAFESIQSIVQSFNAVSMMLESTYTAMHMSFQALLGVAENFTRLRTFMVKTYSTIVTFKLVQWFLNKLLYLLRLVNGKSRSDINDEELWKTLSSTTQIEVPSNSRSWPLVVFTGLLVATPYFVYKLLNSVTPTSNPPLAQNEDISRNKLVLRATCDWSNLDTNTLSVVKGQCYITTSSDVDASHQNGGWIFVENPIGHKGYAPSAVFKIRKIEPSLDQLV